MKAGFERTVEIVPYDPAWPSAFTAEAGRVAGALGELVVRIEHVGSTAVPGLAAKPVIDLQVSLARVDAADLELRLGPLGYAHVPRPLDAGYPFFARPADGTRTHHVHACVAGSHEEHRHLAVRDYLRAHPGEAAAYGALKLDVARRVAGDRQAYADAKDAFVVALQARALAWATAASTPRREARPGP